MNKPMNNIGKSSSAAAGGGTNGGISDEDGMEFDLDFEEDDGLLNGREGGTRLRNSSGDFVDSKSSTKGWKTSIQMSAKRTSQV